MQYLWIFLTVFFAFSSGRNLIAWTIASYFFGWVALVAVILLPRKEEAFKKRIASMNEWSESTITKKQMGKYETVDDLFKQLETNKQ